MAYYYLSQNWDIYKVIGRRVRKIYDHKTNAETLKELYSVFNKNGNTYANISIPMIRRVFPELITHEIVSIQPMTGPIGAVFYSSSEIEPSFVCRKHDRHAPGFKRKLRNKIRAHRKDVMRIEIFRAQIQTRFESNKFYDVIFELSMKNL